ncbi:hypothetical protein GPALN_012826 [Globodera pallida]|nr:hypothetical protein GPALN_012826 [Globodera pallida]
MNFGEQMPTSTAELSRRAQLPVPRARPAIELNLNLDEAIVETVDLIRTVRIQLESISNILGKSLNRTVADVGDDIGRIITNVEAISRNVAESTGQLYQPLLLFLLFLLTSCILLAILSCIIFRTQWEMRRLSRRERNGEGRRRRRRRRSSSVEEEEEAEEEEEEEEEEEKRRRGKRVGRGRNFWWGRSKGSEQRRHPEEGGRPSSTKIGLKPPEDTERHLKKPLV